MISSAKGSFHALHRTYRRWRQKRTTASEQGFQVEEEVRENVVMDAESSLHQKPHENAVDGCWGIPAPEATRRLQY